jgi:hypothetical protein
LIAVFFLGFLKYGNGNIAYFTSLCMISDRYIKSKSSDLGGNQDVIGAGTIGRDWDCKLMNDS